MGDLCLIGGIYSYLTLLIHLIMWIVLYNGKNIYGFTTDKASDIMLPRRKEIFESHGWEEGSHSHRFKKGDNEISLQYYGCRHDSFRGGCVRGLAELPEEEAIAIRTLISSLRRG